MATVHIPDKLDLRRKENRFGSDCVSKGAAANLLGICPKTLNELIANDPNFPTFKIGNTIRIPCKGLSEWVEKQTEKERKQRMEKWEPLEGEETSIGTRDIYGTKFVTQSLELTSANILEVEVGTTGAQGGDAGHGCLTYFNLKNHAGSVECFPKTDHVGNLDEVEVVLGGDCELYTFVRALKFAAETLNAQVKKLASEGEND